MLQANNHSPASTATIAIAILDLTTPWAVNRSALLAESVFDGVRAKMAHLRTGLQERDATIAAVQQVGICHVCVCVCIGNACTAAGTTDMGNCQPPAHTQTRRLTQMLLLLLPTTAAGAGCGTCTSCRAALTARRST